MTTLLAQNLSDEDAAKTANLICNLDLFEFLTEREHGPLTLAVALNRTLEGRRVVARPHPAMSRSIPFHYEYVQCLLEVIARQPGLPERLILNFADDAFVGRTIRANRSFPVGEMLRRVFSGIPEKVYGHLRNPSLPVEALRAFALVSDWSALRPEVSANLGFTEDLAENPSTPPDILLLLARLNNATADFALAKHPHLTVAAAEILRTRGGDHLRYVLDRNPAVGGDGGARKTKWRVWESLRRPETALTW